MTKHTLTIEVAYARTEQQTILSLQVEENTTIEQAILRSGILQRFPEIAIGQNSVGIFGKVAKLDTIVRDKDRVEIYRPLQADPKEVRRQRAAAGKDMKKGSR